MGSERQDLEVFRRSFSSHLGLIGVFINGVPGASSSRESPGIRPLLCLQKIRAVYDSNPTKFKTLQNILEVEKEMHGTAWPKTGATLALMWLKR